MKKISAALIALGICLLSLISCKDKCSFPDSRCNDTVPLEQACTAAFHRWFYNPNTNSCTQISYNGCEEKGFATEAECNACICNK